MIMYGNVKRFGNLLSKKTANLPSKWDWEPLAPNNPTASKKMEAEGLKANALEMVVLTMAFTMTTVVSLTDKTLNHEFPYGIACKVMMAKCQPKNNLTSAELKAKLNKVLIKDDDNPEVLAY